MRKGTFILILSLFFIHCKEKTKSIDKTYEQLEAEVLCDVLPEVAKYELENSFWIRIPPPPPIPEIDTFKFNSFQTDSILHKSKNDWDNFVSEKRRKINEEILNLKEFKKVEFGILDTLGWVNKSNIDKIEYKIDSLAPRPLKINEFKECKIKISLITYENTFEGEIRNSDMPLLFLSRVLLSQDYKKAYFFVFKYYRAYHVFCEFSENRWFIKKIIEEQK
ncbi:hypothetical protein [Flavobacterium sp. J27]|uniref:hypothetical protein n=1 Tax=Flavobacterium sp. J27 TaxID=2060419 RepID=UPI0010319A5A|nr:hypothetical protein [Flavobacterium sp. J27]